MNRIHMVLVIVFSIVVLKYNLSAFVQPYSFESITEVESMGWIKNKDTDDDNNVMMIEFQDLASLWSVDSGYEDLELNAAAEYELQTVLLPKRQNERKLPVQGG